MNAQMTSQDTGGTPAWRQALRDLVWEEGKVYTLPPTSYRVRGVVHCYSYGRQTAEFANGPGNYGAYIDLTRPDGTWIKQGVGIVPVLPDGRLIMVVEQRPPQGRFEQPKTIFADGKELTLSSFGPYSSLEFPGGAVDDDHNLKAAFLRELAEETGASPRGKFYKRRHPVFAMGSDIALEGFLGVIYLEGVHYDAYTPGDGGLHVLALTEEEVLENLYTGRICSGQAMLLQWGFYRDLKEQRARGELRSDYITVEDLHLVK